MLARIPLVRSPFVTSKGFRGAFVTITRANWRRYMPAILEIENLSFAESIREDAAALTERVMSSTGIFVIVEASGRPEPIAYISADRLESHADVPGVTDDVHFGKRDTMYIASVAVLRVWRGKGIGLACEHQIIARAQANGYHRVTAHVRAGVGLKIAPRARVLLEFKDWYATGAKFEYVEWVGSSPVRSRVEATHG